MLFLLQIYQYNHKEICILLWVSILVYISLWTLTKKGERCTLYRDQCRNGVDNGHVHCTVRMEIERHVKCTDWFR